MDRFDGSFVGFVRAQSALTKQAMLELPLAADARSRLEQLSQQSRESQRAVEAADTMPFDVYLQEYLSPRRLVAGKGN